MGVINYDVQGDIAVIEINNPPVNALKQAVRQGLQQAFERANQDSNVAAVVLCGRRVFIAGADISEPGLGDQSPYLGHVCDYIEDGLKPTVAGISGFALGGGLEVALACHYRIADEKTIFGFPEVDIGAFPSAGGCKRFPRVVGLKRALDIIPTGRRFGAQEALSIGLVKKVTNNDIHQEAMEFARSVVGLSLDGRRSSRITVTRGKLDEPLYAAAVKRAATKSPGRIAPEVAIRAVRANMELPVAQAFQKEEEYNEILQTSGQARALMYAFFAQRNATKWSLPGLGGDTTTKPQPIKRTAVIGAGAMGSGIAMVILNAGVPVVLVEQNEKFLNQGMTTIKRLYGESVKLGKLSADRAKSALSMLKPTTEYDDVRDVDLVVEAVYEDMSLKKEVFSRLDRVCKPSAILCSNTSSLSVDEIATMTARPDKVIGTHFFIPVYFMPLLENVRGDKTSAETIATVMKFSSRIGKTPVLVGNCFGFAANRTRVPMVEEAMFLVEEGSLPEQVDCVLEDFGFPLGPLKITDISGMDVQWRLKKAFGRASKERYINGSRNNPFTVLLCESGRIGHRTGKGWYNYGKPNGKQPYNDPWVTDMVVKYCQQHGIKRRTISPQEMQERMLYSVINEGFKVLEEGICSSPEQLDTIWLMGFGWPRHLGGPMYYTSLVGARRVYDRICHYHNQHPAVPHWQPAELLQTVAEKDIPMADWAKHIPILSKPSRL